MELRDAIEKANMIMDDERRSPTVTYAFEPKVTSAGDLGAVIQLAATIQGPQKLSSIRSQSPRLVQENPREWVLRSTNYTLLCALRSQLPRDSQEAFVSAILARIARPPGCGRWRQFEFCTWNGLVSEFPLVAEFSVRNGGTQTFLRVVSEANPMPGHVLLLRHLEDMIALNFTAFSDSEYKALTVAISTFRATAQRLLAHLKGHVLVNWPAIGGVDQVAMCKEIVASADGIAQECDKARYLYLKASLLEGLNLEVNQDKESVDSYLRTFGFSPTLVESLNQGDRLYREAGDEFSLKSCMGHLRSFLERLHAEALPSLKAKVAPPSPEKWGDTLVHLRSADVLSKAEEGFVAGLYTVISDEAVHPLIAEREYARLARNVVIEYALLFLRKLEKLGLKVKAT